MSDDIKAEPIGYTLPASEIAGGEPALFFRRKGRTMKELTSEQKTTLYTIIGDAGIESVLPFVVGFTLEALHAWQRSADWRIQRPGPETPRRRTLPMNKKQREREAAAAMFDIAANAAAKQVQGENNESV
jgi:hypothetical protein